MTYWLKDTLRVAGSLWIPVLCVVAVALIVVPIYLFGLILRRAGELIVNLGTSIQMKLDEWAGTWL